MCTWSSDIEMSIYHKIYLNRCMKHVDLKDAAAAGPATTRHLLHSPNSFKQWSRSHSKINNSIQNNCTNTTQDPTLLLRSGHKQEEPLAGQSTEDSALASSAGPWLSLLAIFWFPAGDPWENFGLFCRPGHFSFWNVFFRGVTFYLYFHGVICIIYSEKGRRIKVWKFFSDFSQVKIHSIRKCFCS